MNQPPLFFDDINDALKHAVSVLGGSKKVGPMLRGGEVSDDAAGRWVLDCLNPDRPAQFHPHQVLVLFRAAREKGDHFAMRWFAGECGYDATPVTPAEEMDRLASVVEKYAPMLSEALAKIERLKNDRPMPPLSSVK